MQPEQGKPDYDFILKDGNKPKSTRFNLPNLSRPALILVVAVIVILLLIIVGTIIGNNKKKTPGLTDVVGRAQEIARVSNEQQNLKDAASIGLAITAQESLTSDQSQIKAYATKHKIKIDPKKLAQFKDTSTDSQLTAAAQNNNLDAAYLNYMRQALINYAASLSTTYSSTKDNSLKALLQQAYNGSQTLLNSEPLKQ